MIGSTAFQVSSRSKHPPTKLSAQRMTPTQKTRREDSFDRESGGEEDGSQEKAEDIIFDYSEAQSKMKEEENKRRVEEGLTVGLTQEVSYALKVEAIALKVATMIKVFRLMSRSLIVDSVCLHYVSLLPRRRRTKRSSIQRRINMRI